MELTDKQLKTWEAEQRRSYKEGKLSSFQVKRLQEAGFVLEKESKVHEAKTRILESAEKGTELSKEDKRFLRMFVRPFSRFFDKDFASKVFTLRPSWAKKRKQNFNRVHLSFKTRLLKMACSGLERPHSKKSAIGVYLTQVTCRTGFLYDQDFDTEIRKKAPHWFCVSSKEEIQKKKDDIIKHALSGGGKPKIGHPLRDAFRRYVNKGNLSFDPELRIELEKLRPDWFAEP